MSDPGQPGERPVNWFAADAQPIPSREPQRSATRATPGGKFPQFVLGVGLGSLPVPTLILTGTLTFAIVVYVAVLVLSFVLIVRKTYSFVGFGMLTSGLTSPILAVISAIAVSIGGPQGYLPPAPLLPAHGAHILADVLRRR